MTMDLLVSGGHVFTAGQLTKLDVAVNDGRIVGLLAGESKPASRQTLEVTGLVVLPGGIDTHAHLREPGFTHKEDILSGTRAAAAGGYTVIVGMPNVQPPTTTLQAYLEVLELYARRSLIDYNHNPSPTVLEEIPGLVDAGALGFKVYMVSDTGTDYPHMPGLGVHDHGKLLEIAEALAPTGRPMMVHAQDQSIAELLDHRAWAAGKYDWRTFARLWGEYDGLVWDSAVSFLVRLQEATGFRLHVLHTRTRRMVEVVRNAKARGQDITVETNPHCVLLCNDWSEIERLGPYALSYWNGPDTTDILWEALNDGTIDVLGSDHAPHLREEKEVGWENMWKAPNGVPKLQENLSLFLTEVNGGRLSLERLVSLFATGPAKAFGLYPRKGAIQVGADADFVVVDMNASGVIRNEDLLTKCGWSPFDGRSVQGLPVHTILRGTFVMKDGVVVGEPGRGQHARPTPVPR